MNFLGSVAGKIFVALFNNILEKIQQWMLQKKLEQAITKAEAAKAVAEGMKEKQETEDKIRAAQAHVDAAWLEVKTTDDAYQQLVKVQAERAKAAAAKKALKEELKK